MKKLLIILLSAVFYSSVQVYSYSENQMVISIIDSNFEHESTPDKGNRMPPKPQTCIINFASMTIQSSNGDQFISYELWDEKGETTIVSYLNDYDMVTFMASQSGCFQLRLVTPESSYIGYIEL